jgi:hypothetical protein
MWAGMDPELRRQLESIKAMVRLRHQNPSREWPLVFVGEHNALLVIREWAGGEITAYTASPRPQDDGGER